MIFLSDFIKPVTSGQSRNLKIIIFLRNNGYSIKAIKTILKLKNNLNSAI